jgi:hypothetical protein
MVGRGVDIDLWIAAEAGKLNGGGEGNEMPAR